MGEIPALTAAQVAKVAEEKNADAIAWARAEVECRLEWKACVNSLAAAKETVRERKRKLQDASASVQRTSKQLVNIASNMVKHWELVLDRTHKTLLETQEARRHADEIAAEWSGRAHALNEP